VEKALKRKKRIKWILFWSFLLAGFAIFAAEACLPKYYQNKTNFEIIKNLKRENRALEEDIERTQVKMKAIRTDPFYNEVVARAQLGMKKPGERIIKVQAVSLAKSANNPGPETRPRTRYPLFFKVLFNRKIQTFLMGVAYILIATAFLFFNEKEYKGAKLPRKAYG